MLQLESREVIFLAFKFGVLSFSVLSAGVFDPESSFSFSDRVLIWRTNLITSNILRNIESVFNHRNLILRIGRIDFYLNSPRVGNNTQRSTGSYLAEFWKRVLFFWKLKNEASVLIWWNFDRFLFGEVESIRETFFADILISDILISDILFSDILISDISISDIIFGYFVRGYFVWGKKGWLP